MYAEIEQFGKWLRRKSPHASTPIHYVSDLKHFFTWAKIPPEQVSVRKVDAYIEYCQGSGYAATTINRRLIALNTFYQFLALEADDAPRNPVIPKRHYVTRDERLPRDASDIEIERLFAVIDTPRDRAMFLLMVGCGLRVGEVRKLSLQDLDLKPVPGLNQTMPRLRVMGKGSMQRTVYLSEQVNDEVTVWLAVRPETIDQAVFLNRFGKRLTVSGIQTCLAEYCRKAGVWITCHQLRHVFGRHLVEARVPVTTIQKLMGHAWLRTTQVYLHVSDQQIQDDLRAAVAEISRRISLKEDLP